MTIAFPSPSSPLYEISVSWLVDVAGVFEERPQGRKLVFEQAGNTFVLCRGRDIPWLVHSGLVDVGLTGYDVLVEWAVKDGSQALRAYWIGECRLSHVVLVGTTNNVSAQRIYAEYPGLFTRWRQHRGLYLDSEVIPSAGSTEGIVSIDPSSLGVLLATTGRTLRDNGLAVISTLLSTDLCLLSREGVVGSIGEANIEHLEPVTLPSFLAV